MTPSQRFAGIFTFPPVKNDRSKAVVIVALKTEIGAVTIDPNNMASRYQVAERLVWQNLADWKKRAILEDRNSGRKDSHILNDFAKEVITMAESEHFFASASLTPKTELVEISK